MKLIPLSRGLFAQVDDEDYEWLMQWKWCAQANGQGKLSHYAVRREGTRANNRLIWMQREIIEAPSDMQVDHADGRSLNNQSYNLRLATKAQNSRNRGLQANNRSGFKGVAWHKQHEQWRALIQVDGNDIHLGYFTNKLEAALAYNNAAIKYFGEFAWLNEITTTTQVEKVA